MPAVLIVLVALAVAYQLFFRYEQWPDPQKPSVMIERDNLTGAVRTMQPGAPVNLAARIFGTSSSPRSEDEGWTTPYSLNATAASEISVAGTPAKAPEPVDQRLLDQTASSLLHQNPSPSSNASAKGAPTPMAVSAPKEKTTALDLNRDGQVETVLFHKKVEDGLLDISVLQGQREVFYGRGLNIQVLSTQKSGWSDVSLARPSGEKLVYRYDPAIGAYEVQPQ